MERGAESIFFGGDDEYEVADFPLSELSGITPASLAALEAAGIHSFFNVLDKDKQDFMQVPGISEEEAESLIALIDELTVVEEMDVEAAEGETDAATEATEATEADETDAATEATEADETDAATEADPAGEGAEADVEVEVVAEELVAEEKGS
jgi:Holliday junction resolvasome RuvABC DNA-binding subunit